MLEAYLGLLDVWILIYYTLVKMFSIVLAILAINRDSNLGCINSKIVLVPKDKEDLHWWGMI